MKPDIYLLLDYGQGQIARVRMGFSEEELADADINLFGARLKNAMRYAENEHDLIKQGKE